MTDFEKITAERQELNLLINKGVSFNLERTTFVRPSGVFGRFKKRIKKDEKLNFTIQEPTLSTLDLLSAEQIELRIDESVMKSETAVSEAKKMTHEHSRRMARILAIAVLGQDYIITVQNGSRVQYKYDVERLDELTNLFFHNIRPSRLLQFFIMVNTMSNLGDFTNSIRLMSAARTTMPIPVEQKD